VSWNHEHVEELLAGFALGGLDAEETSLVERALIEHVPQCASCRSALEGFREIAGDLALLTQPSAPPDTLRAGLRRSLATDRPSPRRWSLWATAGAAVVLVGALSGWNLVLTDRLSDTESRQLNLVDAVSTLGHPDSGVVPLSGPVEGQIQLLYVPGEGRVFLVASGMKKPDRGLYRVWFRGKDQVWHAGSFVPERGVAVMQLERDVDSFEHVLVTHEPNGDSPTPAAPPVAEAPVLTTIPAPTAAPTPSPTSG
jgi:hypothetical protein